MEDENNPNQRELVEKFRKEYTENQQKKLKTLKTVSILGILILIGGIIMAVFGFNALINGPFENFGYWIGGIFVTMLGVMMTIFSFSARAMATRVDMMVPYVQNKLRQEQLKNTDRLMEAVGAKVPQKTCPYCGFNNSESSKVCAHCGASI
jgi:Na+/melibiose symporter-like transporter